MADWGYRRDASKELTEMSWTIGAIFGYIIVPILIVCALIAILLFIFGVITLPARSARDIAEKTLDADNIIGNYEWFKQRAEDLDAAVQRIQITEDAVADLKEELPENRRDWDYDDKQEMSRLRTDLRGQKAHYENLSAEFRARSKMANRAIFKNNNKIIKWVEKFAGVKDEKGEGK